MFNYRDSQEPPGGTGTGAAKGAGCRWSMCQHFQQPGLLLGAGAIPLHALTRDILGPLPCIQLLQCPSWHFSPRGGRKEEQQHGKCHMREMLGQSRHCSCPGGRQEYVGVLSKSQGTKLGFPVQLQLDPASEWHQCPLGFGEGAGRWHVRVGGLVPDPWHRW